MKKQVMGVLYSCAAQRIWFSSGMIISASACPGVVTELLGGRVCMTISELGAGNTTLHYYLINVL